MDLTYQSWGGSERGQALALEKKLDPGHLEKPGEGNQFEWSLLSGPEGFQAVCGRRGHRWEVKSVPSNQEEKRRKLGEQVEPASGMAEVWILLVVPSSPLITVIVTR